MDDTSNIKVKFSDFNNKAFQWEIDSQEEAAFIKRLVTDNRVVPPKEQLKWEGASRLSFLFPDGEEWVFQTYLRGKQNKLLFSLYDFSAKEYYEHSTWSHDQFHRTLEATFELGEVQKERE